MNRAYYVKIIAARPRPYHSPARQQAAAATRDAIAAAALELFRTMGYRRATIREIAELAGVSPQTVYFAFRSKQGILTDLVRRAKDDAAVAPTYAELIAAPDPRRKLALSVDITARWAEAAADLIDLVRAEAASDPDVAAAWHSAEESRRRGNRALIKGIATAGGLRQGLTIERATALLWSLESTDLYRLLVGECGWTRSAYVAQLNELLTTALLPADG